MWAAENKAFFAENNLFSAVFTYFRWHSAVKNKCQTSLFLAVVVENKLFSMAKNAPKIRLFSMVFLLKIKFSYFWRPEKTAKNTKILFLVVFLATKNTKIIIYYFQRAFYR
jgi:hypothetical protein